MIGYILIAALTFAAGMLVGAWLQVELTNRSEYAATKAHYLRKLERIEQDREEARNRMTRR